MKTLSTLLLSSILFLVSCDRTPETLYKGGYDESSMNEAMQEARDNLSLFQAAFDDESAQNLAVKVRIADGDDAEYFWLTDLSPVAGGYEGTLNNEPGIVSNVKFGQRVSAVGDDLCDWLYMKDKKMYGNYTLRILMQTMSEKERRTYAQLLAPLTE